MASHDFGIMETEPMITERFDTYESDKYNCIQIHDDFIEPILLDLQEIDFYWHTLEVKGKGLAYWGITIISPKVLDRLREMLFLYNRKEYDDLIDLIDKARKQNKYMIHFGI